MMLNIMTLMHYIYVLLTEYVVLEKSILNQDLVLDKSTEMVTCTI